MTTAQLRRQIKEAVDHLPAKNLEEVAKVVTAMSRPGRRLSAADRAKIAAMERRIEKARRDAAAGRTRPWREIRQDV